MCSKSWHTHKRQFPKQLNIDVSVHIGRVADLQIKWFGKGVLKLVSRKKTK